MEKKEKEKIVVLPLPMVYVYAKGWRMAAHLGTAGTDPRESFPDVGGGGGRDQAGAHKYPMGVGLALKRPSGG